MRRLTTRQRAAAITLAVLALCFITLDLGGGSLATAHSGVRGALGSLYRGTDGVLGPVRRWVQGVPTAGANRGRIDALTEQNQQLRGEIAQLEAGRKTSAELSALQRGSGDNTVLPSRVTAYGPGGGFDWTVSLNVGTHGGVKAGQTVVDGAGLVGRVLHADADSCTVLLAADPGSGVGVRDVDTGELGVVTGRGAAGFGFAPLKPGATVHVGDALETGPNDATSFVTDIPVGTVTAVRTGADGTVLATVAPATSPTAVDVVGVIVQHEPALADRATPP